MQCFSHCNSSVRTFGGASQVTGVHLGLLCRLFEEAEEELRLELFDGSLRRCLHSFRPSGSDPTTPHHGGAKTVITNHNQNDIYRSAVS